MNITNALQGGLKKADSIDLLQEALSLINKKPSKQKKNLSLKAPGDLFKKIKRISGKKGLKADKAVKQVGKLLANTGYLGLSGIGKKRNAIIRGGLLGAAAGLVSIFSKNDDLANNNETATNGVSIPQNNILYGTNNKILTVTLYTVGGLIAGTVVKKMSGNKKLIKWIKKNKSRLLENLKDLNLN